MEAITDFRRKYDTDGAITGFRRKYDTDGAITDFRREYDTDGKSTDFGSEYVLGGKRTGFRRRNESGAKSTEFSSEYESGVKSTEFSSEYESGAKSTEFSSEYESGAKSTEFSSEYGSNGSSTEVSSEYDAGVRGSVLGISMQQEKQQDGEYLLGPGDRVGDYMIVRAHTKSGEAQVFVGEKDGKECAVKIYMRNDVSLEPNVIKKLKGQKFSHLSYMVDAGKTQIEMRHGTTEKTYEISPWYSDLDEKVYRYDNPDRTASYRELKKLIEHVNEGLRTLNDMGIAHRDIKPANIMMDEKGNYRIIDFGISRELDNGQSTFEGEDGITHDYAAPEAERDDKSGARQDYYSLGLSLYKLYMGELPYAEHTIKKRQSLLASKGVDANIPLERGMPRELIKLIHGLTYYSNNEVANKDRWGYDEVQRWLKNPDDDDLKDLDMTAEAEGNSEASRTYKKSISYHKQMIADSYTLADELGSRWAEGMEQVGRGNVRNFFQENGSEYNEEMTECEKAKDILQDTKKDYRTEMKRNKAFWNLLYLIEPKLKKFYWHIAKEDGTTGYTCEELGAHLFLKAMENKRPGERVPDSIRELVDSGLIPVYLTEQLHDEERGKKAVGLLDDFNNKDAEIAAWRLGYLLTGKALFDCYGHMFETREHLYEHVIEWTNMLTTDEAVAVARDFEYTKEFQAWIQNQEDEV